jgi:cyclic pyranopterin phosphate synthase
VIPSLTEPFCADCRRLRLTASGKLLGCLAREEGLDIRSLLRECGDEQVIVRAAAVAMSLKNAERDFQRQMAMFKIGG